MVQKSRWMGFLAVVAIAAAGCGGGDGSGSGGEVNISGSSTVEPISTRVAEFLEDIDDTILVNVDGPGTGDGFALFCAGETDISDASRPIKEAEVATCDENGVEFVELEVAYDGLSVLTNPENVDVTCLTTADLYALMGPESGDFDKWSDAQGLAEELGSTTIFPDGSLDISAPGQESGTYDAFVELALLDTVEARLAEGKILASDDDPESPESEIREFPGQADDAVIISGIGGSPSSFGWVGFAFAEGAGDGVKEVEVDGGDGCIAPTSETIADGSYPLSRSLYIYVSVPALEDNAALAEYVDFYLSDEGMAAVADVGYVDMSVEDLEAARSTWEARTTGTAAP